MGPDRWRRPEIARGRAPAPSGHGLVLVAHRLDELGNPVRGAAHLKRGYGGLAQATRGEGVPLLRCTVMSAAPPTRQSSTAREVLLCGTLCYGGAQRTETSLSQWCAAPHQGRRADHAGDAVDEARERAEPKLLGLARPPRVRPPHLKRGPEQVTAGWGTRVSPSPQSWMGEACLSTPE